MGAFSNLWTRLGGWKESPFAHDLAKLFTGTVLGRAIALVSLPMLTRFYSPEDYRLLSIYAAIVSTVAVSASLRLEIAIPLASSDDEAANIMAVSLVIGLLSSVFACVVLLLGFSYLNVPVGPGFLRYVPLVGAGIFLAVLYSVFQYWATRYRRFSTIAKTRVTQSVSGAAISLAFGVLGGGAIGLMLGNMINRGAGNGRYLLEMSRQDRDVLRNVSWRGMASAVVKNRSYPIFSASEALINVAGLQVPIFLISSYAGEMGGHVFLAMQITAIPMSLIGSSIGQVYISRASAEKEAGSLNVFTAKIVTRLIAVGCGPLIFGGLVAPLLVPIVFGKAWHTTGGFMPYLVPWMVLQFLASPISMVMYVVLRQRKLFMLTTFGAVIRIGAVLAALRLDNVPLLGSFAAAGTAFYAACLLVFIRSAGITWRMTVEKILPAFKWTLPWLVLAGLAWVIS